MLAQTFAWWLAIEAIGLIVLPIVLLLFQRLPGRGYAFAKPVGLLLAGYLYWLALSFELLPNRPGSIVWTLLPLTLVSAYLLRRRWPELRRALEDNLWYIVAVEVVFLVALMTAAHLRSFVPEVAGTEKPMDFMLLNTAGRSRFYTPDDPWLAGFGVSYYYFGYVIQAMLGKLAGVSTGVAFNLGVAGTAALAVTAAFGLGYEIARLARRVSLRAGLAVGVLAIGLVTVIGNLEGVIEFGIANGYIGRDTVDAIDIHNLELARESDACLLPLPGGCLHYPNEESNFWWWWRATRISPDAGTISEFPFFSFLLGDLHPHVMAIPFVLSVFGLGLSFWATRRSLDFAVWRTAPPRLLLAAVLVGALGFLNTWDLPTFAFLLTALVLARNLQVQRDLALAAKATAGFVAPLLALAALLYAPFYLSFSSQASGFQAVTDGATRPLHGALFWAPLVLASLPLPLALLLRRRFQPRRYDALLAFGPALALLALWVLVLLLNGRSLIDAVADRGWNWSTFVFYAGGFGVCLLALRRLLEADEAAIEEEPDHAALVPVVVAIAVGLLLLSGAELFYIQDVFGSRLNTVFKLGYQAWLLLGVGGAYGVWWLVSRWRPRSGSPADLLRGAWASTAALVLAGSLLYPLGAVLSRTDGNPVAGANRTLDGLAYARASFSGDYRAAIWLRDRAGQGETMVEAIGEQYSSAGRIAVWSGVPAVLGWRGHEVQWGRDDQELNARVAAVNDIYSSNSLADALAILQQYDVTYVVVGSVEREKYPEAGLSKFEEGLIQVYAANGTVIYRLPIEVPASEARGR